MRTAALSVIKEHKLEVNIVVFEEITSCCSVDTHQRSVRNCCLQLKGGSRLLPLRWRQAASYEEVERVFDMFYT